MANGVACRRSDTKRTATKRAAAPAGRPSALLDTNIVYCGDCLDQFGKLPDGCVELARVLKKTGSFYYHCDWQDTASSASLTNCWS